MLIGLLVHQIQPRRTVRAQRVKGDSGKDGEEKGKVINRMEKETFNLLESISKCTG